MRRRTILCDDEDRLGSVKRTQSNKSSTHNIRTWVTVLFSLYSGGYSGMCGVWESLLLLDYIYKPTTDDRVNDSEWVGG